MVRFYKNRGVFLGDSSALHVQHQRKLLPLLHPDSEEKRRISPLGRLTYQTTNVLISANLVCRARGSCASCTRTTWSTSETEPRRASRSASTSSDRGGGTAALWTTRLCLDGSCRSVSFLFDEKSGTA